DGFYPCFPVFLKCSFNFFEWCICRCLQSPSVRPSIHPSIHRRAAQKHTGQTTTHTHPFTPKGNVERPINSYVFGYWEEAREPTHAREERANSLQKSHSKATLLPTVPNVFLYNSRLFFQIK
ncbi:hypothetical protein ATANTOWER_027542, partial [Ataeniobius toweri]|nr:hypothetical protein [Ataeniobius toweri]